MEDWILGLLLVVILIIFLYINNTQHIYRHNDKLLNNDKTNNTNLNNKLSNNVSNNNLVSNSINNSSHEKFTSHDDSEYINLNTITNNSHIYLKNSNTKFKFQLNNNSNKNDKIEFIFDGDLKTDYQKIETTVTDSNNVKFETELTPNTFYNLTVKKNGNLISNLTKTFTVGDKRFNYLGSLIEPTDDDTEKDKNLNLKLEKNGEGTSLTLKNDYLTDEKKANVMDNCLKRLDKLKNNGSAIKINYFKKLELEQFNLISFKMTIPEYNSFYNFHLDNVTQIFNTTGLNEFDTDENGNGDATIVTKYNTNEIIKYKKLLNDLNNFIPDRFETELLILDSNDFCPINFNDNKYVKPTIEKINVNQTQKNYLLKFKFIKDKFYNRKVIYIAKITLVYTNLITLGEKRSTKDGVEVDVGIERNNVPYYLAFTVNNIATNDVLIKDLNFLEELNKQNQVNKMFKNSQKLQDNTIDNLEKEVNNVSKDAYLFM